MTKEIIKGGDAGNYELSADINVITAEINAYQRVAGEAIFEIGRRLKHVKENDLAHGEFGKWHEKEFGFNRSVAAKFMKVVEELPSSKVSTLTHFGLSALHIIATLPPEQRDQPHTLADGTTKTPDEMTVRELREVKKALKEAEARRLQAEQRARQAEQEAQTARRSEEIAQRQLEEFDHGKPEVEIRTEYVEVAVENPQLRAENDRYKELFGELGNYTGDARRVTNGDAITYEVFAFQEDVREFIEKYGHLTHFTPEFDSMIDEGKQAYKDAIGNMLRFMKSLNSRLDEGKTIIIDG